MSFTIAYDQNNINDKNNSCQNYPLNKPRPQINASPNILRFR